MIKPLHSGRPSLSRLPTPTVKKRSVDVDISMENSMELDRTKRIRVLGSSTKPTAFIEPLKSPIKKTRNDKDQRERRAALLKKAKVTAVAKQVLSNIAAQSTLVSDPMEIQSPVKPCVCEEPQILLREPKSSVEQLTMRRDTKESIVREDLGLEGMPMVKTSNGSKPLDIIMVLNSPFKEPRLLPHRSSIVQKRNDDPLMVSEYADDIFANLKECEESYMPMSNYMASQPHLSFEIRKELIHWLTVIANTYHLHMDARLLMVNLLDRVCSLAPLISLEKVQLVGLACLMVSAKTEEIRAPHVGDLAYMANGIYSVSQILEAERAVLGMVGFKVTFPNPSLWFHRILERRPSPVLYLARYFLDIWVVEKEYLLYKPSMVGSVCVLVASRAIDNGPWTRENQEKVGYDEESLCSPAFELLEIIKRHVSRVNQKEPRSVSLFQAYSTVECLRVSVYTQQLLAQ